jgi:translocation and assembly module TamA
MLLLLHSLTLCLMLSIVPASFSSLVTTEPVKVRVEGVEGEILKNVQALLAPPDGLMDGDSVDRPWLELYAAQAEAKVRTALEPFGYYRATVITALTGTQEDGFTLNVTVVPGECVHLTEVKVEVQGPGASQESVVAAVAAFPLKTGDLLSHQKYESGKSALLSRAQTLGYLDADFPVHEVRVFPATGTAQITLLLQTGHLYRFGPVTFQGAPLYPDDLLRRYVAFKSGAPFSYDRLGRTQTNLSGSGYFKEVTLLPVKEEAVDFEIPVQVRLKPAPGRTLRPGAGYGTDTGFRGSLSYKELNLFQRGHVLTLEGTASENFLGIAGGYVIPSPDNLNSVTGLQATIQREEVTSYLSSLAALEVNQTESFGSGRLGTAYLRLQYELYTVGQEESSARLVMPGLRFSGRRYDSVIRPTSGYNYTLELRGTHRLLGSDTGFLQALTEGASLLPLPGRFTLGTRGKIGATLQDDPLATLPASLRFYAGGDSSVRGYAYKSLGPTDDLGQVIGGSNLLQGSLELERALLDSWGVSLFYDVGNAFQSFTNFRLYQGAGIGLHYYTRVGGLNLSLARQVGVSDPGFRVHFTIGFQP